MQQHLSQGISFATFKSNLANGS